jgi:hypothetical protein
MKHALMTATFVFASTLAVLSQVQSGRVGQSEKLDKRQALPSPVMGFKKQPDAPLRMLYEATFAIPNNRRTVEVKLIPESESGRPVRRYTAYCEERIANPPSDGGVVKQLRRFSSQGLGPSIFRVEKDSELTFWVSSVEFEDGTTWEAKLH